MTRNNEQDNLYADDVDIEKQVVRSNDDCSSEKEPSKTCDHDEESGCGPEGPGTESSAPPVVPLRRSTRRTEPVTPGAVHVDGPVGGRNRVLQIANALRAGDAQDTLAHSPDDPPLLNAQLVIDEERTTSESTTEVFHAEPLLESESDMGVNSPKARDFLKNRFMMFLLLFIVLVIIGLIIGLVAVGTQKSPSPSTVISGSYEEEHSLDEGYDNDFF